MTSESCRPTMNSLLPRASLSPAPPVALHLLMRQSVIPLSRSVLVRPSVKERVLLCVAEELLCEAIARRRSYSGRPTRSKPALESSQSSLT